MSGIQVVRIDKRQFITERNGYDDWRFATWRELFHNSTDAGADRFTINMGITAAIGAFGEEIEPHDVIRLEFTDNGRGMTRETLENVFFNVGMTTKSGSGAVGGFGTARQMLCFSHDSYQIHTGNLLVEGNGPRYALHDLPPGYEPVKGCRFIIDIDQRENGWCSADMDGVTRALKDYLSLSQTPGVVTLNGERLSEKLLRGQARRTLVDDEGQVFATAYTSEGKRARSGTLVIRQSGSAMFHRGVASKGHIIIEIEQGWARKVMNDKRSALVGPYRRVLDDFVSSLIVDQRSAMSDKSRESITFIKGRLGAITLAPRSIPASDMAEPVSEAAAGRMGGRAGQRGPDDQAMIEEPEMAGDAGLIRLAQEKKVKYKTREQIVSGMPDFVMQCRDLSDAPEIAAASRRWHPENWGVVNHAFGRRGLQMYQTLMGWTSACRQAADLLRMSGAIRSDASLKIIPGWCFCKPGEDGADALMQDLGDGQFAIMLNPVLPGGGAKFMLSSMAGDFAQSEPGRGGHRRHGLRSIAALACHEVAHIASAWHGEVYANVLTNMMQLMDQTEFCRKIQDTIRHAPAYWPSACDDEQPAPNDEALSAPGG